MRNALPLGFVLPPDAEALFIPAPDTPLADALAHLEASAARLAATAQRAPSLVFGELAAAEWDLLHQRHAELHLGYIHQIKAAGRGIV
jgi:hypothetical protein